MVDLGLSALTKPLERLVATAQNGYEVARFGGLDTGMVPSPFQIVESTKMYKLRRYFPPDNRPGRPKAGPPVLMVHPMMMSANMWDVTKDEGAVGILHDAGIDPWVIDYGSPDEVEGGMERTLTDHIVALSQAIDTVKDITGQNVHLAGYSQGGMFCYQTAAFRRSKDLASVVAFGSPVDTLAGLPGGLPANLAVGVADFLADHVFSHIDIPGWLARTGFQMLDPIKSVKSKVDFLFQLHDREALLPREQQRRFLDREGWIAWSGPAVAELLKQFVAHNRMMTGGFAVEGQLVTLSDITCPVLAFVGEVDDIGQPPAVRGIKRAAPNADVYEVMIRAGHFGLVVGSKAANNTWPTVADWVLWVAGREPRPANISLMKDLAPNEAKSGGVPLNSRLMLGVAEAAELAASLAKGAAETVIAANTSMRIMAVETMRTLPRLVRLGQINDHTRISLGRIIDEQAESAPNGEFLLFDGRVHTYEGVNRRIDNVVRGLIEVGVRQGSRVGVLMDTRPSALVAIAALSRLGAVAVLMPPDADLVAATRLGGITDLITDPANHEAASALPVQILVLGGGENRQLDLPEDSDVIDMEQIDPDAVELPGWYRPNPSYARDVAFVVFSAIGGGELVPKQITNYRWALSAFGTASAAALTRNDTVYCLTPLHHQSGLLVSLGGSVVAGSRIALSRGLCPERFLDEVRQYGVSVVTYTWSMLSQVVDAPDFSLSGNNPIRLFMGSGMPTGLWERILEVFAPAKIVEFFATSDGQAVLANVAGVKVGSEGRPLPGGGEVELGAYDPVEDLILEDNRGFVKVTGREEVGILLAKPWGPIDPTASIKRGVFAAGDIWISTEYVFYRDADGDYWLLGNRSGLVRTPRGVVFPAPITDAVGTIGAVDLAVTYGVDTPGGVRAVTAITLRPGMSVTPADIGEAVANMPVGIGPDVVHVVPALAVSASYRPVVSALKAAGIPKAGRNSFYLDTDTGTYKRLSAAARNSLVNG
ncbi:MAG: acyl-CoA synthetase [Mycobacterium sp.]